MKGQHGRAEGLRLTQEEAGILKQGAPPEAGIETVPSGCLKS